MPQLTQPELRILSKLTPHTRAHALQLFTEVPLLRLTSGLRTADANKRAGGVPNSWHLKGRGTDWTGALYDLQLAAVIVWQLRVGHRCTGPEEVLLEDSGEPNQHLHVAW